MVDWDGLENRCASDGTVGSNPTLSSISLSRLIPAGKGLCLTPFMVSQIAATLDD